jgi:hypothetical protein
MTPFPAGHQFFAAMPVHRSGHDAHGAAERAASMLLDLGFAEFDVLFRNRVVFLFDQFVRHGARILPRHIIETGVRAGHEFDFYRRVLGHNNLKMTASRAS